MMHLHRRLGTSLFIAIFAIATLALGAADAFATHFRYGSISWTVPNPSTAPRTVQIRFDAAWRWTFPSWQRVLTPSSFTPVTNPPVGMVITSPSSSGFTGPMNEYVLRIMFGASEVARIPVHMTVTGIDNVADIMTTSFTTTYTFPATGAFRIEFNECCRLSTLQGGNADRPNILSSGIQVVNVAPVNRQPVAATLPILNVLHNQTAATFTVPAFDPDGDPLAFSIPTPTESGLAQTAPAGFTIHPLTGVVTWNTTAATGTLLNQLYAVQIRVADNRGASTVVDLLLRPVSAVGSPPTVRINNQPIDTVFNVVRGTPMNFSVSATDPENAPVTLTSSPPPVGSNMSPSLPTTATGNVSSTFTWTPAPSQFGTYVISFSAVDGNGLQGTRAATIIVSNNLPTIVCTPSGGTIEATGPVGANFSVSALIDDADDDPLSRQVFIDGTLRSTLTGVIPGTTVPFVTPSPLTIGSHSYEVRVSDGIGLPVSCAGTFSIVDTTAPSLTLPPDAVLDGSGPAGAVHAFTVSALDIVSGIRPVTCSHASGASFFYGTTTVTCSAMDAAGNLATGSFDVTVNDPTPPVVTYDIAGVLGDNDWYTSDVVVTWTVVEPDSGLSSTSGCDPTTLNTDTAGIAFTCAAANNRGGSTDVTTSSIKRDATPPSVAFTAASIVAEATSAAGAVVTFDAATISDALSGIATSSCTHASGDTFGLGTTDVRCDATDNAGNSAFAVLSITVEDTTDPVIVALVGGNIEATSPAGATLNFATPGASDAVDPSVTVTCTPATGSPVGFAPTTVTCTATDDAGNSASTSAVFAAVDTIAPAITSPGNQTATGTDPSGAAVSWAISASDAATATVVVTCTPASGSTFAYGTTTVNCTAPDHHGNTATASFTVTVNDLTPPSVTPTVTGTLGANDWYMSDVTVSWAVSDPDSTISSSTGCTTTTTTTDGLSFSLTCSATSAGGTTSQTVTFKRDATAPVVTTAANQSAAAESSAGADVSYPAATAQDAVSGAGAVTCTPASGSTFPIGTTTVTCTATNGAGLTGSATFTVTVTDRSEPGKMYGEGDVRTADSHSLKFNFVVLESRRGFEWGDVDIKVKELRRRGGDVDRFDARTVDDVRFTNSPDYGPGRNSKTPIDTVVFSGTGKWEGRSGYRYVVTASDRGEPGRGRDTFTIEIVKIATGQVVFSGGGTLSDGNVQSTRLQKPWWWWTNHRDRDRDRGRWDR